jgi:Spy/CpxP family protein refolding chaperone
MGMGMGRGQGMGPGMGMGQGMGPGMGRGMGPGMGHGFGGPMGNRGMRGQLMRRGMARLNLTQAQKDQMKAFRDLQQKDTQAVRERMKVTRQQLQEAMKADIPDEAAVKAAAGAMATVQTEQFAMRARAKAQMMKVLTPEQQTQLKQQRARMNRMARWQMQQGMARRWRGWR